MDLFILRHGEAGKRLSSSSGNKDSARPLTVTGHKEVADIAASLKDLGNSRTNIKPLFIAVS